MGGITDRHCADLAMQDAAKDKTEDEKTVAATQGFSNSQLQCVAYHHQLYLEQALRVIQPVEDIAGK